MFNKKMKYIFLIGLFFTHQAFSFSFEKALKLGIENSHEIKILKLEKEAIEWEETKAFAGYLPHFSLQGRHLFDERFQELEVDFEGNTVVMPAIQPYSNFGVEARFNLFNGFETTNDLNAAKMRNRAEKFRLKRALDEKEIEIRSLYYAALGAEVLVEVADQNIKTLRSHLNDVKARVRSGVSNNYDSLRVEVQLDNAIAEKESAANEVALSRAKLFKTLGVDDDGEKLEGELPKHLKKFDLAKINVKESRRLDRKALMAEKEEAKSALQKARSHWYPKIDLAGNYEWYNNINHSVTEEDKRFKNAYAWGIYFSWDLFDGGEKYAEQKEESLKHQIASERLKKFDQGIILELEEAKRKYSYNLVNYQAKLSSISKAKEAVRLARNGVAAGIRTNTEVLDAVLDLNRAKASAVKSQVEAIRALGKLELAIGHHL